MRRGALAGCAAAAVLLCSACGDDDDGPAEPAAAGTEQPAEVEATARPDAAPIELPVAPTASEPLDPSPALGVHRDALTLGGDMLRLPLEDGRVPAGSLEDGEITPLRQVLANLRFRAGGVPGHFHSALLLRADRAARWDTVHAAVTTAAAEGFVDMKVVARTGEGDEQRQMRVRVERDDTEPHLRAHLDADGLSIRAPRLGTAVEGSCGEAPEGPLVVPRADAAWDWDALEACERSALREIVAETPEAGVTAADPVAWERVVHALDRLRALRADPSRLALLLE